MSADAPEQPAAGECPDEATRRPSGARRLRSAYERELEQFAATDPSIDISRHRWVDTFLRDRRYQFTLILPNQILFWLVVFAGILGPSTPGRNFATAITWYVWFCVVFLLTVVIGRGWCAMCPFGGFAEWIQRRALWRRTTKTLSLGWKLPESAARHGLVISAVMFVGLTWIEEYFNIAGPGAPIATSYMVLGIVGFATVVFLLFERRTFCRYFCPLSALIGTIGAMGTVAGFRTRDRDRCLDCPTKDCMRGGADGFGCPWYTWPGSADSNLMCGLCSECYKACPHDNVGLFVQKPLTSVTAPVRRRWDVALSIVLLAGLPIYQQFNATPAFTSIDDWLNAQTGFPHYPNPIDFLAGIALVALGIAGAGWLLRLVFTRHGSAGPTRESTWREWFVPLSYTLIPVVGANFLARQLPKFLHYSPRMLAAVSGSLGIHTSSRIYDHHLLSDGGTVTVQVAVVALGLIAAIVATWRIAARDLAPLSSRPQLMRLAACAPAVVYGAVAIWLFVLIQAAD